MPNGGAESSGDRSVERTSVEEAEPGTWILHVTGDVNRTTARGLQLAADELLSSTPRFILVDLSRVGAMTTHGVRALVQVAESAGEADIGLGLVAGSTVRAAFVAEQVDELFELYDTLGEGRDALH
jgi:anti-sigma B factor antagonist